VPSRRVALLSTSDEGGVTHLTTISGITVD
jgi:hypothetical protein